MKIIRNINIFDDNKFIHFNHDEIKKKIMKEINKEIWRKEFGECTSVKCVDNNCCMFLKHSNFLEWLNDSSINPKHNFVQKESTSQNLEYQVWNNEFNVKTNTHCPINRYNNIIMEMKKSGSWCSGLIKNGGETISSNLRPLCTPCYHQMSDDDLNDYEENKNNPPKSLKYKDKIMLFISFNNNYMLNINVHNQILMSQEIYNENEINDYLITYNNKTENIKELINLINKSIKHIYNYYK